MEIPYCSNIHGNSQCEADNCQHSSAMDSRDVHVIKTLVISAVIIVNMILNSLVIAVIARNPQLRDDRTALFVFSLALSDLALGCTVMPISAALCSNASPEVRDMITYLPAIQRLCFLWFFLTSSYSLGGLTMCKMFSLLYPLRYEQFVTCSRCYAFLAFIWLIGVVLAASAGDHAAAPWNLKTCIFYVPDGADLSVMTIVVVGINVLALIIIVYATARIFWIVMRAHLQIRAQVNSIGGHAGTVVNNASLTLQSIRSGRNVLLVCLGLLVFTIPIIVLFVDNYAGGKGLHSSSTYAFAAVWMAMSNSIVNSLLYLVLFRGVRKKTYALFRELFQLC